MEDSIDRLPWETDEDTGTENYQLQHDENEVVLADDKQHDNSLELWLAMEEYHKMGLSMIWGRMEKEIVGGKIKKPKAPIVTTWSSEPETKYTLEALAKMMHRANAKIKIGPIIICGRASGNLIVIDIDITHWPGIDSRFFKALQDTYPDLWAKLRIHQSPSGGFHLIYRTEIFVEMSNVKLAYKEDALEAGIETRGHGGYVMAPPGAGPIGKYTVYRDVPIPTISVIEHERIINMAMLFNEKAPKKTPPKQKHYESIYDENPFEHFNSSPAAEFVLRDQGWKFDYENSQFTQWTRPGKDSGVSASWHKEKRFFHFFTTSSQFDGGKNYSPANVLCTMQFNGDWKKLYAHLATSGYGKHKPGYEKKVIEKNKQTGKPLPANFSPEAKEQLTYAIIEKTEKYPHGTFWEFNVDTGKYMIQRTRLEQFLYNLGLRLYKGEPCIIEGQFLRKLKEDKKENGARDVFNIVKSWIREEEEEIYLNISHEFSKFWQASGEFMITTLTLLDESLILKSNSKVSYKFFANGILSITKEKFELGQYQGYPQNKIWADSIIQKNYRYVDKETQKKSMYVDFLGKALDSAPEYVQLCIGFLVCGYKGPDDGYFVVLQEPRDTSKGGGSGKGYFCKALSPWISVLVTNAEAVKKDIDQLIQNWNGEDLVHLSDLPRWVNLSSLKNIISDDSQRKLLYKNITNVAAEDMPKFVGSTQYGLDIKSDGGVGGRVRELAFSDYFGRNHKRISDEYGGKCPDIWDSPDRIKKMGWVDENGDPVGYDWDGYFSYLTDAVIAYKKEEKLKVVVNKGLWVKGFDVRFSDGDSFFREAIDDQIRIWGRLDQVTVGMVTEWYEGLCAENKGVQSRKMKMDRVHAALREYGEGMEWYEYRYGEKMGVDREYDKEQKQVRVVKIKMLKTDDLWDAVQVSGGNEDLPF